MKEKKWSYCIYILIAFLGIILFFPNQVYAEEEKEVLLTCKYAGRGEDITTRYNLIIYDDYSTDGIIKRWQGRDPSDTFLFIDHDYGYEGPLNNADSLKEMLEEKTGSNKCPNAILIIHVSNGAGDWFSSIGSYKKYDETVEIAKQAMSTSDSELHDNFFGTIVDISGTTRGYIVLEAREAVFPDGRPPITLNTSSSNLTGNSESYTKCVDVLGDPTDSKSVAWLLQKLFNYIKVLGPILVILLSALDFTKTILASDDEAMKKAQKRLGIRLMCAVGIYFLPMLITLLLNLVFGGTADASAVCGIK